MAGDARAWHGRLAALDLLAEISRGGQVSQGRLGRLSEHLIQQRSFYPLFPGTNGSPQLDLRHSKKYALTKTPDILVTPSKLSHFVKSSQHGTAECFCINPGQLVKGNNGGTFARVTVHPMPEQELAEKEAVTAGVPHRVVQRTKVEIMKI